MSYRSLCSNYANRRLLTVLLLGFSSGLPIALTGTALQAWYTVSGLSLATIGFLALLGQPYVYKFLWAPFLDRYVLPFLGRRRGWLFVTQILMIVIIGLMSLLNPIQHPLSLAMTGMALAFFSATQDIAFNAYQTEILGVHERGLGASYGVTGYRLAMMVSGGLSFILADRIGWQATYQLMALCMLIGVIGTFISHEPPQEKGLPTTLSAAMIQPLKAFFERDAAKKILLFIILYKLGDAFALTLSSTFFIRGLGFSQTDVGIMMKGVGLFASIAGVIFGGALMLRMGLYFALFWFGLLQAFSNLSFMVLALCQKSLALMGAAIFLEQACSGMGTAAFVAFLMSLCDKRYTATQYALLSAIAAVGRVFVGPLAGIMVQSIGWVNFYAWSFIIALPGLVVLWFLRDTLMNQEQKSPQ
jgi:MFS transporter, PAT family, beta-lactamase induction signal transducer AmpG